MGEADLDLANNLFIKTLRPGQEVGLAVPYRGFFPEDPDKNILLITRGYIYSDKQIKIDDDTTIDNTILPLGLESIELVPDDYDDPGIIFIYNLDVLEIKKFNKVEIRKEKGAPKIEYQELLDAGWKQIGFYKVESNTAVDASDYVLLVKPIPHAVSIPEEILNQEGMRELFEEQIVKMPKK